jgi:hypothetical protein
MLCYTPVFAVVELPVKMVVAYGLKYLSLLVPEA